MLFSIHSLIQWPWEITFVPLWIVLCISLVGVLYTIIFAGILLRMPEVNVEQRRTSTNSALGKNNYINTKCNNVHPVTLTTVVLYEI